MIIISEDGKTFVKVEDWSDVVSRPGFMERLNPKDIKLKNLIGQYNLYPAFPCGLTNCRSEHNRGYIVVAAGGLETNIGNVCGKREFGVEFNEFKKTFKQGYNAQRFREKIGLAQATIDHVVVRVSELLEGEHNGEWCYQQMHSYMTRLFPDSITKPLSRPECVNENETPVWFN